MGKDLLVILMIAFGLFAILMFILFFIYLKKYYNSKHIENDYKKSIDHSYIEDSFDEIEKEQKTIQLNQVEQEESKNPEEIISFEKINSDIKEVEEPKIDNSNVELEDDMEFIPIKKK